MGYSHTFYSVDIRQLKSLNGSNDKTLLNNVLSSQSNAIRENDAFFEDDIESGDVPDTATAIGEIIADDIREVDDGALYGYALKIICQHLGEPINVAEVADVADHPYESFLRKCGSPIWIPDVSSFPEVGYLMFEAIEVELSVARKAKEQEPGNSAEDMTYGDALNLLSMYMKPGAVYDEDIRADVEAYIETLEAAQKLGKGIVSFRH